MPTTQADRARASTRCPICRAKPGAWCTGICRADGKRTVHDERLERYHREHPRGGPRPRAGAPRRVVRVSVALTVEEGARLDELRGSRTRDEVCGELVRRGLHGRDERRGDG